MMIIPPLDSTYPDMGNMDYHQFIGGLQGVSSVGLGTVLSCFAFFPLFAILSRSGRLLLCSFVTLIAFAMSILLAFRISYALCILRILRQLLLRSSSRTPTISITLYVIGHFARYINTATVYRL
jgi:hypothetical protein